MSLYSPSATESRVGQEDFREKKNMFVWIFRRYAYNVFPDRSELVWEYYDLEGIILSWKRFSFRWKMVKTKFAHGGFDLPSQINLTFTP